MGTLCTFLQQFFRDYEFSWRYDPLSGARNFAGARMAMAWEQGQVWIGRVGRLRQLITLPPWARTILMIVALPGILAVALSVLAFLVSLLALLVLTVPVYRLLAALTQPVQPDSEVEVETLFPRAGVKRVDATVRDATEADVKQIE